MKTPLATDARVRRLVEEGALQQALAVADEALSSAAPADQVRLLLAVSEAHLARGEHAQALRASLRVCALGRELADPGAVCDGLVHTAAVLRTAGDLPTAISTLEQAEGLALQSGDRLRLGRLLRIVGVVSSMLGRHQQAMSSLNDAALHLQALEQTDDLNNVRLSTLKARIRHLRDRREQPTQDESSAEARAETESLLDDCQAVAALCAAQGQARLGAMALGNHAITLNHARRWREAIPALQALVGRYRKLEMWPNVGLSHVELGVAHEALAEPGAACEQYTLALTLLRESGWHSDRMQALEGLARVQESAGDIAAALAALKELRAEEKRHSADTARQALMQRELRIELARLTDQWARQATTDPLTGLANRRGLDRWLQERWAGVERGRSLALVLLDLDHFKAVNDRHGHDTGDAVLIAVARLLQAHGRSADLAVRYGGEEFLLALDGSDGQGAAALGERLRAAVAAHPWQDVAAGLVVTTSIGIADSAESPDAAALLTLADKRLYAAKLGGRNRVVTSS